MRGREAPRAPTLARGRLAGHRVGQMRRTNLFAAGRFRINDSSPCNRVSILGRNPPPEAVASGGTRVRDAPGVDAGRADRAEASPARPRARAPGMQKAQALSCLGLHENSGRGERIRTSGLYVPNVALYQAKLHPDFSEARESLWRRPRGLVVRSGMLLRRSVSLS